MSTPKDGGRPPPDGNCKVSKECCNICNICNNCNKKELVANCYQFFFINLPTMKQVHSIP